MIDLQVKLDLITISTRINSAILIITINCFLASLTSPVVTTRYD